MDEAPERDDANAGDEDGGENPERQGPGEGTGEGPSDAPDPDEAEQGPSGPPPESVPGDAGGGVPNPRQ